MADAKHWEVASEEEMWLKTVGKPQEDVEETRVQAEKIFAPVIHQHLLDCCGAEAYAKMNGDVCVEIGSGAGRFAHYALEHFKYYIGVDSSDSIIKFGPLACGHPASFYKNDGYFFPHVNDGSVDFVFSITCFQHMPMMDMVQSNLGEARRVLRPTGLLRAQTVMGDPDSGRHDGVVFADPMQFAREVYNAGFSIVEYKVEGEWIWITARKR